MNHETKADARMIFSIHSRTGHQLKTTWATITLLFTICGGFLIFPTWVRSYSLFQFSPVSGGLADDDQTTLPSDLAGMIAIWNGSIASIPEGWALCDGNLFTPNLTDRFVQSTDYRELPGKMGGILSHNHSYVQLPNHNHAVNDPGHKHHYLTKSFETGPTASVSDPDLSKVVSYDWGETVKSEESKIYLNLNYNGTDGPHSTSNNTSLPPYIRLPFIMKINDSPLIPAGIIAFWSRNLNLIPKGWVICNGSTGVLDLTDRLIMGTNNESQIGSVGGNATHLHAYESLPNHTHTVIDGGHQHTYLCPRPQMNKVTITGTIITSYRYSVQTISVESSNAGVTIAEKGSDSCFTDVVDNYPPYMNLVPIMKESNANILPTEIIMMWAKDIEELPLHTFLCDGLNATPNLYSKFIRTVDLEEEINRTGGSVSHFHRYDSIPKHFHTTSGGSHIHNFIKQSDYFYTVIIDTSAVYVSLMTNVYLYTGLAYSGISVAYTGDDYCSTDTLSILPPYYRLGFFMTGGNLTQIPWEDPADECPTCNDTCDTSSTCENTSDGCSICLNPLSPELLYAAAGIGGIFFLSMAIIVRKRRK